MNAPHIVNNTIDLKIFLSLQNVLKGIANCMENICEYRYVNSLIQSTFLVNIHPSQLV